MKKIAFALGIVLVIGTSWFHWPRLIGMSGLAMLLGVAFVSQTGFLRWWTVICAGAILGVAWRMDASPSAILGPADPWILPVLILAIALPTAVNLVRHLLRLGNGARAAADAATQRIGAQH